MPKNFKKAKQPLKGTLEENSLLGDAGRKAKRDSKTVKQQDSKTVKKKVTYYIAPELIKKLKFLGVEKNRDLSDLIGEAINDLLKKYKQ